jgi:hypothetical protein
LTRFLAQAFTVISPIRVTLYEFNAGHAVFQYDQPPFMFGQFDDEQVSAVARGLDAALARPSLRV